MSKWKMVKLGDVCNNNIQTISSNDDYQIDYIDISSVDNQTKKIVSYNTFTFKEAPSRARQILQENDILVSTVRPNLNAVAINSLKSENIVVGSTGYCVLRCNDKIERDYLFYFCQSETFILALVKKAKGASYPAVSNSDVKSCLIPLPPLDEQKRIADVLDKASELIKKRKEQIRLMDELAKSLFIEMFGDPVENPMGWDVKKLGDLLSDSPQNGLYKPSSSYANGDEGTPILRIDAFYDGKITDLSQLKRLHCNENEIILYSLEEGDIVINRVNSMEYLGKCAYIPVLCESTVFESNMMRLKIQRDILHPRYAVFLLCSKFIQQQIMSHAKKAVNQASINQTDVMDFNFHIPPLSLQNEFADRIDAIEQQKALLQNGLAKMETAYKALMQEYFG